MESAIGIGIGSSFRGSFRSYSVFSDGISSRGEDEDEALQWAALERLPTYDRLRKGIITDASGEIREVDVRSLNVDERRRLLEKLVKVAEDDNERFLKKLKARMDRVGIENPTIEVRFEDLDVSAEAYVGERGVPTIINFFLNKIEEALNFLRILPSRKVPISILHGVSGIIKPSRLTLLLGPPGSGKTTLLLALAGKLDSSLKVSGKVTYNGYNMNEFVPQRTSAYISQNDVHIGQMTVRETLAFSARCQGVGTRYDMLMELSKREKAANIKPDPDIDLFMKAAVAKGQEYVITDYVMKVLGLEICANTVVGDRMMRGISGGQKKRVTTGEMLVGPSKALFMDEISTGLDSSTTFQIINSLKQSVHILNSTALIALLQPAPETYELFDDIILLSEGQIVYQGPREHVLSFFEFMGFKCPERKGVADFLQEVTSRKDQEQYWMERDKSYRFVAVNEFADAFQSFHVGQHLENSIVVPFDKTKSHPAALTMSKYGISKKELLRTCLSREYLLMKRNSFVYIFKLIQVFITGLIAMTVFIRSKMHHDTVEDANIYLGALFVGLLTHLYNGFAELAMSLDRLPIFYKQRNLRFYPAWAYSLPSWILKIPVSILECALWTGLTYYAIGFDSNVQRMFRQYLIFTLLSQMAFGLFRFLAALGRDVVIANTFGTFAMIVLLVLGGFALSRNNIGDWWIWAYWGSPLMYAQNAVAVNEFLGHSWRQVVNVTGAPETLGVLLLKSRGYFPESYWYWIGVGGLLGYVFILNFLFAIALTFLDPIGKGQTVLSKEILNDKEANRTGKHIEQPNQEKSSPSHSRSSGLTSQPENCTAQTKKGMVLPFTPLAITFENIKYSVDMPSEMKEQGIGEDRLLLLNDLNGAFRPGVLTALMGVSGAGKTTLMDLLAGRKTGGYIEGCITISGYPKNQETFARISGYCEQNDIHSPNVTVYESLLYSAWLRLPAEVNSTTRKMFIEEVMELVELTSLRESIVGLPGVNGLSTEQRKRLTIAVELIANPSIIFMDEPTSGLDARAAAIVMRAVRNTVDTGRTVVCTIHQPSIDIFESFDELFLIKRGGEEIYVGPLGRHSFHLINYFEVVDGLAKIRDGYNPATWMLEVTTSGQEETLGLNFTEIYKNSELYMRNKALIRELSQPAPGSRDLHFPTQYSQPFFVQCLACLWKQHKSYWRNPSYSATRIFFTVITSLLFGTIFWRLGSKRATRQDLFNAIGGLYAAVMFVGVQNSQMVQPVVDVERTVFYREKAAGMYAALPYAIGQVVIEVPYVLLQTLIYEIIVYSMVDFAWTIPKFFWFFFFIFTAFLYFTFYGMMAVALTPNSTIAAVVATIFYNVWNLFAGFILPRPRIPIWWRWYYWICPVSWTLYGLLTSQFGDIKDIMETGETVEAYMKRFYGYRHELIGVAAIATIGFDVLFAFIFAYSIKSFNFQKR